MRVLEGRRGLGVRLESTHERWVGCDRFSEDLHGDVAPHVRLDRAEHGPVWPVTELLEQTVPAQRFAPEVEGGVVAKDAFVHAHELG